MMTLEDFKAARKVLDGVLHRTDLMYSPFFSKTTGNNIYIKPENMQVTGAYKIRGAYFKCSTLTDEEKARGLAAGVSTLAKLLNPSVKVYGVEPTGAASMKASLEAGHVSTLPRVDTIADGVAVKTPGDKVFPYIQQNIDGIITIGDDELVDAFLDVMEKHKMIVENAGLLTIAALKHLSEKGANVVPVLSGGNMDVITISSLVQHGLLNRGRIFTFSVQLPDRPGELVRVAQLVAGKNGNIIRLDHNQFVNLNRQSGVELKVTLEAFGHAHKQEIMDALAAAGYDVREVMPSSLYN